MPRLPFPSLRYSLILLTLLAVILVLVLIFYRPFEEKKMVSVWANLPSVFSIFLIDHEGTISAHHPGPEKRIGGIFKELPVFKIILLQEEGALEGTGIEGVKRFYNFTSLADHKQISNIFLAIGIPKEADFALVDEIGNSNVIFIFIISMIAILAALIFGNLLVLKRKKTWGM